MTNIQIIFIFLFFFPRKSNYMKIKTYIILQNVYDFFSLAINCDLINFQSMASIVL